MALLDRWMRRRLLRRARRALGVVRLLAEGVRQLTRIAEALAALVAHQERVVLSETPPATAVEDVSIDDVDTRLQAEYEVVSAEFFRQHGRQPDPEELLEAYGQRRHLFRGSTA